jgi:DNA invertase Pin-like site-specific DNA recombinase
MAYSVAFYCRVSTDDQTNENQKIALTALASANGWDVVRTFEDTVSGRRDDRAQFKEMLAAASRKEFDAVVVWSLDRFGRQGTRMTLQHLDQLESYGVGFKSLQESYLDSTTDNPFREVFIAMRSCIARLDSVRIGERISLGLQRKKANGGRIGRKPVDIDHDHLARLRSAGLSKRECARRLRVSHSSLIRLEKRAA